MSRADDAHKRCCDVLEVSPTASPGEIKRSYLYLKELYTSDSIASMALEDELSDADKQVILAKIEQAYATLMEALDKEKRPDDASGSHHIRDEAAAEYVEGVEAYDGATLKQIREKMGIGLDDIAMTTRIQTRHLSCLEHEDYEQLPAEVYTRGFVFAYAEFLSLDGETVVADYMQRYRKWKTKHGRTSAVAHLFSKFRNKR
ncbi:MAG: helix-turn-helix domain-containing protein [Deltaproteobacteria bacterium]|nr:helix-turn-helix domain-containing protein [Deltaproteobacteria bacterium]